jgi:hypothetical protein
MYEELCLVFVPLCSDLEIGESADCAISHRGLSSEIVGIRSGYAVGMDLWASPTIPLRMIST